jgi:methionyl aminopeptidase
MSIETEKDLSSLMLVGKIVGLTLRKMKEHVRPGITTGELDAIGAEFMQQYGVRSAPMLVYNFPGTACISVNDEAAHGIPGGYYADAALTVPVLPVPPKKQKLCDCARSALSEAIGAARAGSPLNRIGAAAEADVRRRGFKIVSDLSGHGVGRSIHEEPTVPNFYVSHMRKPLTDGLVLAVEPHVTAGNGNVVTASDGWTIKTRDGSAVANFEHTIVATKGRPIIVTAA